MLRTNDPAHPEITVAVRANVKPLPDYVKRISTADVEHGESVGAFQVWPTARPLITLEQGEKLKITLRIRPLGPDAGSLKLPPDATDGWKLRHEPNGDTYWVEIQADRSGAVSLPVELGDGRTREIRLQLTVNVPAENLTVTPREIDFGEVTLETAANVTKRLGVRKLVGSFHLKSVTCSLPFVKLEQNTIVEGSNYLIRASINPLTRLKAGAYQSAIVIETDDGHRLEVPVRIKISRQ